MEAVCRVCLTDEKYLELNSIFDVDSENVNLSEKIMKCSKKIKIQHGDNFPAQICVRCTDILDISYKFINLCEQSDELLKKHYPIKHNTEFNEDSLDFVDNFDEVKLEPDVKSDKDVSGSEQEVIPSLKKCKRPKREIKNEQKKSKPKKNVIHSARKKKPKTATSKVKKKLIEEEEEVKVKLENVYDDYEDIPLKSLSAVSVPSKKKRGPGRPKKIYHDENGQVLITPRSFVCERCGKSFKHLISLRGHERRHTGEKPFMCSTCGKTFHVPNELRKHMLIHSGLKPYKCTFCERTFTDWGSRLKHERCHLGERPYKCDQCLKTFSYSYVLAKHKLTHTGSKPFLCDICKKTFRLKYHLTNHCRKHHNATTITNSEGNLEIVEYKNHFTPDYEKKCRKQKIVLSYENIHGAPCEMVMDV